MKTSKPNLDWRVIFLILGIGIFFFIFLFLIELSLDSNRPWNRFVVSQVGDINQLLSSPMTQFPKANQDFNIKGSYLVYYHGWRNYLDHHLDDTSYVDADIGIDPSGDRITRWSGDQSRIVTTHNYGWHNSTTYEIYNEGVDPRVFDTKQSNAKSLLASKNDVSIIVLASPFFINMTKNLEQQHIQEFMSSPVTEKIKTDEYVKTIYHGFIGFDVRLYDIATKKIVAVKRFDWRDRELSDYPIDEMYKWLDAAVKRGRTISGP
jgi:hypothetical protein